MTPMNERRYRVVQTLLVVGWLVAWLAAFWFVYDARYQKKDVDSNATSVVR